MRGGRLAGCVTTLVLALSASATADTGANGRSAPAHRASTRVDCELDVAQRTLQGRVTVALSNPTAADLDRAYVWLQPNRFAYQSPAVNDINYYWVYPDGFDPGWMRLEAVSAGADTRLRTLSGTSFRPEPHAIAGRKVLWSIALPEPIPPGGRLDLVMDYRAKIPERYGTFGCVDGRCTLMGGFYPMLAAIDHSGWDLEAPPLETDVEVNVDLTRAREVVLFGHWSREKVYRFSARAEGVPYATLLVAPRWYRRVRRVGGVAVEHLAASAPPPAVDARGKILPYTLEDYQRAALDVAQQAFALISELGAPAAPGTHITLVEAPIRHAVASAHPGAVLVSDQWLRIWPAARFRKFHRRELARVILRGYFADRLRRRHTESPRDIPMVADVLGAYLMDVYTLSRYRRSEFADDILEPVAFVQIIDQLLYAPQAMFSRIYFRGVLDGDPLRDGPHRFMHQRPRGRFFFEKLRDLLGAKRLRQAMHAMLVDGRPLRRAAETAYGADLDWFFRQWSLPYPRVNYRLLGRRSRQLANGQFEHSISIAKETAAPDHVPVEPVEVLVYLQSGEKRLLVWDGKGSSTTLSFRNVAPIERVVVDPRGRLVESKLPGREQHPRFDNRDEHRLRLVYQSLGVLVNVTDLSGVLAADFAVSRVHDVKNRMRILAFTSDAVRAGVNVGYRRSFGPTIDPDTLLNEASLTVGLHRLNRGFFAEAGDADRAASRLTLTAEARSDDRLSFFQPQSAHAIAAGATLSLTRLDQVPDADDGDNLLVTGVASVRLTEVFTPRPKHTLAFYLTAYAAFGEIRLRSQVIRGGGIAGVRGFAPGELWGRLSLEAHAEYRHWFVHDINWNFGHYTFLRGIGGALFFDATALSPCESYDLARKDAYLASVGYGLRFPYDSFGTMPQLMRLDVAVRLNDPTRRCFGAVAPDAPPVQLYLSFVPPF